ncbi:hypothetical protein BLNAU_11079 [Blattamonas nauphoetae]|uniref:Uncharacterized protein n=1 Tax=Blattamonas nauphoetae TaxID=2049346 RepID=A0ABQ9XNI6_9EUKA|nr:hypothetical protein BLNAU_11079 [Blattamonas nauphoetae]
MRVDVMSPPHMCRFSIELLSQIVRPDVAIIKAAMEMLEAQLHHCSEKLRLTFVKADLIPQIISTLNPVSLSFVEAVDIHTCLLKVINHFLWLATPFGLNNLEIEDGNEHQAVHKTIFKQVLVPLEEFIYHLQTFDT